MTSSSPAAATSLQMTATPDGLLLVDKPAGVSSHDVVMVARRVLGEKRIGHAGTLDPFATGLLVLLVGRATRLLSYLPGEPKVYEATVRFGEETETDDPEGGVTRTAPLPRRDAVTLATESLTGEIEQVPSKFSAKRVGGRRAYALARKGETPDLAPARVTVFRWEISAWEETSEGVASCDVRVTCSGGTYVRALARDAGRAAGSAAHLTKLRRVSSGPYDVDDATSYDDLKAGRAVLRPATDAIPDIPRQEVAHDDVSRLVRGLDVGASVPGDLAALVDSQRGVLVALAERRGDRWQPRVVMPPLAEASV